MDNSENRDYLLNKIYEIYCQTAEEYEGYYIISKDDISTVLDNILSYLGEKDYINTHLRKIIDNPVTSNKDRISALSVLSKLDIGGDEKLIIEEAPEEIKELYNQIIN